MKVMVSWENLKKTINKEVDWTHENKEIYVACITSLKS